MSVSISPDNSSLEDDEDADDASSRNHHAAAKRPRTGSVGDESPVRRLEATPRTQYWPVHHGSLPPHAAACASPYPQGYHHRPYYGMHPYPPLAPPPNHPCYPPYGSPPPQQHQHPRHRHYRTHLQTYKETIRVSGLPKALSFRKICSKCGRTRGEHGELGFGNKCTFDTCGKCGASCKLHSLAKPKATQMGILCCLTVEQGGLPGRAEVYDRKIRNLAARAEIQKSLQEDKRERTEKLAHHMVARGVSAAARSKP